ncbi:acyl carrier protein [Solihabitans fulvus]|uniref:Acyl carrier protein n=1 Tax=Solihabitans fulvus TaxID=1892852 RepID=A0A5B2XDH7_9PSEU|nr:phosphopantetheine-binding protein [Solihabitans fulvus]KAA2261089.1 acyl carrier protein [Solihabitans fulvus]
MTSRLDPVREWILARHPELDDLDSHLDLIENRLIDSLTFIEFVFLIEQHSGESIPMDTIQVDDFRTLNSIGKRYFQLTD